MFFVQCIFCRKFKTIYEKKLNFYFLTNCQRGGQNTKLCSLCSVFMNLCLSNTCATLVVCCGGVMFWRSHHRLRRSRWSSAIVIRAAMAFRWRSDEVIAAFRSIASVARFLTLSIRQSCFSRSRYCISDGSWKNFERPFEKEFSCWFGEW